VAQESEKNPNPHEKFAAVPSIKDSKSLNPWQVNSKLPVLVCHGENDPIAKADWGRKTFDYLTELGMPTEGNIYPDMGHEFKPAEVQTSPAPDCTRPTY
jgi:predicted esterase